MHPLIESMPLSNRTRSDRVTSDRITQPQRSVVLPAPFPNLPENPHPDQITGFLMQLNQAIERMEFFASETDLKTFVKWALEQSYSHCFTQDQKFQLLSIAWEAQKLLWSLRTI